LIDVGPGGDGPRTGWTDAIMNGETLTAPTVDSVNSFEAH
jgi:hypothetical protein